jgi:predicted nucleotidyltransferase
MIGRRDIRDIVDRIVKGYDPEAIILFGSQAQGTAGEDSDVDLLILKCDSRRSVERNRQVRQLLAGITHPIDVFVRTPQEYEQLRNVVGSLPYEASRQGRVVYERESRKG